MLGKIVISTTETVRLWMAGQSIAPLRKSDVLQAGRGPLVLLVLDGVGIGRRDKFDAFDVAPTPVMDRLFSSGLFTVLKAHGTAVGLPSDKDMGNSEVGHNTLGAGRIFDQGPKRVENAIESDEIWGATWKDAVGRVVDTGGALHLIGLLSDGNVHSNVSHLYKLIDRAGSDGVRRVYVHVLLDGRDVPDHSAEIYVRNLEEFLERTASAVDGDFRIASGGGRMITTMDRYGADWEIVARGWRAQVLGTERPFVSASEAIQALRAESPGISDQLLPPFTVVDEDGCPVGKIANGDSVIVFNFRGDRVIEVARAFTEGPEFDEFDRVEVPDVFFAGMALYDSETNVPENYLVEPEALPETLSQYLAATGVRQFACAETQKFGHVTYFWNGNRSGKFDDKTETYVEIPSDRVPFDQRPWMKSAETADELIQAVESRNYDFLRVNFAGGDMVGHTGRFVPSLISMAAIDLAVGRVAAVVERSGGCLVITADHGNVEDMAERDRAGEPIVGSDGSPKWKTSHSLNPVPFSVNDYSQRSFQLDGSISEPGLANVASTIIRLLGYEPPQEFLPSVIGA